MKEKLSAQTDVTDHDAFDDGVKHENNIPSPKGGGET